ERLDRLRASAGQGWAREDLKRLQQETTCERVRSEVIALLTPATQPAREVAREPAPAREAPVNTPELVLSAQSELRRLGCFTGAEDGNLSGTTREAIQRYLSQKGRSAKDVKVTDQLVADLKGEDGRVCPLSCSRGEHPEGDRCIANVKPEKTEKPKAS